LPKNFGVFPQQPSQQATVQCVWTTLGSPPRPSGGYPDYFVYSTPDHLDTVGYAHPIHTDEWVDEQGLRAVIHRSHSAYYCH